MYDCGSVARVIKDVEAQSTHKVEISLDTISNLSLLAKAELVSLDGKLRVPGITSEGKLVFAAVTPGSWRLCDPAKKVSVSSIIIGDDVVQASSVITSMGNIAVGTAAIGGGVAAMVFGSAPINKGESSDTRGGQGSVTGNDIGATPSSAALNTSAGSSSSIVSFVGHNETAISPFS